MRDLPPETLYPHEAVLAGVVKVVAYVLIIILTPFVAMYLHHGIPREQRHSL